MPDEDEDGDGGGEKDGDWDENGRGSGGKGGERDGDWDENGHGSGGKGGGGDWNEDGGGNGGEGGGGAGDWDRGGDRDRGRRFSMSLPPIRLPPLFPDRLRISLPVPGFRDGRELSSGWALIAVLGFDVLDAVLATAGPGPVHLVRTVGGTAIAVTVGSWLGLLALWEVLAVLFGVTQATVVPTVSLLLLWALYRKNGGTA